MFTYSKLVVPGILPETPWHSLGEAIGNQDTRCMLAVAHISSCDNMDSDQALCAPTTLSYSVFL